MGDRTIRRNYDTALMHEVLGRIEADPHSWAQHTWVTRVDCGTAMCFAGHALVAAGVAHVEAKDDDPWSSPERPWFYYRNGQAVKDMFGLGARVLGITEREAETLFDGSNSLTRLHRIVEMLDAEHALTKAGR